MRSIFIGVLLAGCVSAQPPTVRIVDTFYDIAGNRFNGQLTISLTAKTGSAAGVPIISSVTTTTITNGSINLKLVPNPSISPANSQYILNFQLDRIKTCVFPASSTPLTIGPYCSDVPATSPLTQILASQIVPGPSGMQICSDGTVTYWGICGPGYSIVLLQPDPSVSGFIQRTVDRFGYTIKLVSCSTDQGTVTINLDIRSPNSPNTPGTNVLASPLVCNAMGTMSSVVSASVPAGAPVALDIIDSTGTPGAVRVNVSQ